MSVHSWRELPRVASHKFGESPKLQRRFVLTLTDPGAMTAGLAVTTTGALHGTPHPELAVAICTNVAYSEGYEDSRYHAELVADYEIPEGRDVQPNPLNRPDQWTFESSGAAIPALYYFQGGGNNNLKPLVNSAGDYFEGLTVDEAQQKVVIQGNRATFPSALAAALTNCVNSDGWLGAPAHAWKCQGIRGERKVEVVNDQEVRYWEIVVTLLYRQTGWNLQIPDVGFNYIESGKKKRAWVLDPEDQSETRIPSTNPVALNGSGGMKSNGDAPNVLVRRIYKEVEFAPYFGQPPS